MKFVNPWFLLLIPAVTVLAAILAYSMEKRKKALLAKICGNREVTSLSRRKRQIKYVTLILGASILVFAAARPYFRIEMSTAEDKSRDVLVLFDVSKSMRATDLPPNRMEQAKYLLREIFREFPSDRFGIVPFAGKAFLSCPLTADHQALLTAVNDLDTGSVPIGGTDLGAALETAKRAFAGSEGDHRAIILLTDGDQLSGNALKSAANLKSENIPVIAVGFGSPDAAAPVPGDNGGVMHSLSGEVAGSRLDETLLQKLAAETGGIYLRSTVSDTGFTSVKNFLDKLNKASTERISRGNPVDLFGYFLAGAFLCLLFSAFLSDYRKTAAVFLLMVPCFMLYGEEKSPEVPVDPVKLYKDALDRQQSGSKDAEKLYNNLIAAKDTPALLRGRSLHNLAVMRHIDARETMIKSRNHLQSQNSDEALKEVNAAIKDLEAGKELYSSSMEFKENPAADNMRTGNYQQLILDLKDAEKLKKQLEELKKQQQQAQNQAQQAQQQNQQQ
ncbi:MAG: VWA domain-containing protein, partial [Lentisphaeria bacterium]|nr:VWA domain-containing protein [Lentisphaeria bacterium]